VTVLRLTIHFGFAVRSLYERQTSACLIREAGVSEASGNVVYACDQWEIDLGRRELRSRGIPVPLGGRAFEIVTVLVQSATELVTKDHMMERVWPGAIVGEGTLHVHISAVRKALGQDRAMLKTVSGRGYRLLGSWTPQQREGSAPPPARRIGTFGLAVGAACAFSLGIADQVLTFHTRA
jgi:DNA-binding winged helix-turn-helix (wHTH) protein